MPAQGQVLRGRVPAFLWSRCASCAKCGWQRKPVVRRVSTYGRAGCVGRMCRVLFQAEPRSTRIFGSCWRRSCGSAFPMSLSQAPILTHGLTPVSSRQAVRFLLHGAVWTLNFGASRSVASAFFSLLTSLDRLRRSYYLMYLAKRETAGRRSHRCTDSMQTGS